MVGGNVVGISDYVAANNDTVSDATGLTKMPANLIDPNVSLEHVNMKTSKAGIRVSWNEDEIIFDRIGFYTRNYEDGVTEEEFEKALTLMENTLEFKKVPFYTASIWHAPSLMNGVAVNLSTVTNSKKENYLETNKTDIVYYMFEYREKAGGGTKVKIGKVDFRDCVHSKEFEDLSEEDGLFCERWEDEENGTIYYAPIGTERRTAAQVSWAEERAGMLNERLKVIKDKVDGLESLKKEGGITKDQIEDVSEEMKNFLEALAKEEGVVSVKSDAAALKVRIDNLGKEETVGGDDDKKTEGGDKTENGDEPGKKPEGKPEGGDGDETGKTEEAGGDKTPTGGTGGTMKPTLPVLKPSEGSGGDVNGSGEDGAGKDGVENTENDKIDVPKAPEDFVSSRPTVNIDQEVVKSDVATGSDVDVIDIAKAEADKVDTIEDKSSEKEADEKRLTTQVTEKVGGHDADVEVPSLGADNHEDWAWLIWILIGVGALGVGGWWVRRAFFAKND